MRIELDKYTVIFEQQPFRFEALRHNQPWRDLTGDKLALALVQHIEELDQEIQRFRQLYGP